MVGETSPTTKAELEWALDVLISRAYKNGVDVGDAGYTIEHDDPHLPDWEVLITRIVKPD